MNLLFRMKPWLMFVILIFPFIVPFSVPVQQALAVFLMCMMLWFLIVITWTYKLGMKLYDRLPDGMQLKSTAFIAHLFVIASYLTLLYLFFLNPTMGLLALVVPFHIVAMVMLYYVLCFLAKGLVAVEQDKPIHDFRDYGKEWTMFLLLPIGIWKLQPRIQAAILKRDYYE